MLNKACRAAYKKINHTAILASALKAAKNVDTKKLLEQNYQGKMFADAMYVLQLEAIKDIL
ncbi:MAG: hypothetical protein NTU49_02275 [Gammaproteobacteria bacterium]|nr:hypothetical protein [Gammaproteobacteria bacterium]